MISIWPKSAKMDHCNICGNRYADDGLINDISVLPLCCKDNCEGCQHCLKLCWRHYNQNSCKPMNNITNIESLNISNSEVEEKLLTLRETITKTLSDIQTEPSSLICKDLTRCIRDIDQAVNLIKFREKQC